MRWIERLRLMQWRALEESDLNGLCLSAEHCREATRAACPLPGRDPLQAGRTVPAPPIPVLQFLRLRAAWLEKHAGHSATLAMTYLQERSQRMVPSIRWWSFLALIVGFQLPALGPDRVLNILALPLMGVLLWNGMIIAWSIVIELRGHRVEERKGVGVGERGASLLPGWAVVERWIKARSGTPVSPPSEVEQGALERLQELSGAMLGIRSASRLRVGFHIAAAVLAVGCVVGMYARGWSREYMATWESTVFEAETAGHFLGVLYAPASLITGIAVPVDLVPAMHDSVSHVAEPQRALPWIHLYAGTLGLFVVLPRLLLAALAFWRSEQRVALLWKGLDWEGYAARLQRAVQGSGEHVQVLLHGWGEEARDRWSRVIRQRLGGQVAVEYATIPAGEEDEFERAWQPLTPQTVLVFNAATIPEVEVQGTLALALRTRLHEHAAGTRLLALVDAQPLSGRRSAEALGTRVALWQETLKGRVDEVMVGG